MAQKMGPGPVFYIFQIAHLEKVACPLFYGATWQSLKKRKRDEHREAIKYSL
jgi:hypothetical protein